jgi:hypothetical protein
LSSDEVAVEPGVYFSQVPLSDRPDRPLRCSGRPGYLRSIDLFRLAANIVEATLDGRQPKGLRLAEVLGNGPLAWEEQWMSWARRFADGEGVTGLRTDDRGPDTNDYILNAPEPRPLAGPCLLLRVNPPERA